MANMGHEAGGIGLDLTLMVLKFPGQSLPPAADLFTGVADRRMERSQRPEIWT